MGSLYSASEMRAAALLRGDEQDAGLVDCRLSALIERAEGTLPHGRLSDDALAVLIAVWETQTGLPAIPKDS